MWSAKLYEPSLSNEEIADIQNEIFRLRAESPLQIGSLFISYSHRNERESTRDCGEGATYSRLDVAEE